MVNMESHAVTLHQWFMLKKWLGLLLMPLPFCAVLLFIGLFLL